MERKICICHPHLNQNYKTIDCKFTVPVVRVSLEAAETFHLLFPLPGWQ